MNNNIKNLRIQNDCTQDELAKALGVARSTLSFWENGNSQPDAEMLIRLADYFQTTVDIVLNRNIDFNEYAKFTEAERAYISLFKKLDSDGQQFIISAIEFLLNR